MLSFTLCSCYHHLRSFCVVIAIAINCCCSWKQFCIQFAERSLTHSQLGKNCCWCHHHFILILYLIAINYVLLACAEYLVLDGVVHEWSDNAPCTAACWCSCQVDFRVWDFSFCCWFLQWLLSRAEWKQLLPMPLTLLSQLSVWAAMMPTLVVAAPGWLHLFHVICSLLSLYIYFLIIIVTVIFDCCSTYIHYVQQQEQKGNFPKGCHMPCDDSGSNGINCTKEVGCWLLLRVLLLQMQWPSLDYSPPISDEYQPRVYKTKGTNIFHHIIRFVVQGKDINH